MQPEEKNLGPEDCSKDCSQLLQLILDGQATPEQATQFQTHICSCQQCEDKYKIDTAIKEAVKKNCGCQQAPDELRATIQGVLKNIR